MSVSVLVAGDFCPQYRLKDAFEKKQYETVLGEIISLTSKVDYSIVNFECPIIKGNEKPIPKNGPNLSCSEDGALAVKWAGFDCVTLANNHFLDYGELGVQNTIDVFNRIGIDIVGGGRDLEHAEKIMYKNIKGRVLAIINCCEHEFSIATETTAGSNPLNPIRQFYEIQEAKQHADFVLVIVHGGHEHFQYPSPRMQETYRFFIDAGADAVVNHHQHCYSGYETYKGKPVFYGIGNFCFDFPQTRTGIWTEGYAVVIDFDDIVLPSFNVYPYKQCASLARVELLPIGAFNEKLEEINTIIADPIRLGNTVSDYYALFVDQYSDLFEPVRNRYYLALKHRKLLPSLVGRFRKLIAANFILCESHRDRMSYWLNNE